MRGFFTLLLFYAALFGIGSTQVFAAEGLLEVEIIPAPNASSTETITLGFAGTGSVDLSGWIIADAASKRFTFAEESSLVDGQEIVLCGDDTVDVLCDIDIGSATIWNNSGDTFTLSDSFDAVILEIAWDAVEVDETVAGQAAININNQVDEIVATSSATTTVEEVATSSVETVATTTTNTATTTSDSQSGTLVVVSSSSVRALQGEQVNVVISASYDAESFTDTSVRLSDSDSGGEFYSGTTAGACNSVNPDADKVFTINTNKGVCYSNAMSGEYTVTVDLFDESSTSTVLASAEYVVLVQASTTLISQASTSNAETATTTDQQLESATTSAETADTAQGSGALSAATIEADQSTSRSTGTRVGARSSRATAQTTATTPAISLVEDSPAPAPLVLGEQVSIVPINAPNTGFGGSTQSSAMVMVILMCLFISIALMRKRLI